MFLIIVVDEKTDYYDEIPKEITNVLQQFEDVIPPQLSKKLPLRRVVYHHIELVPAIKPPS